MSALSPDDFAKFFQELYGYEPFPWQKRLLRKIAEDGEWPDVLDLPTGSGKTAAIDIGVFHLALESERNERRRAPVRIAFVVDRRLVVDDAFERARMIAERLQSARPGSMTSRVAENLKKFSGSDIPLVARRLRGGVPREDDWARTPAQPTVLCSTVDQVGSRLLFRGYGVSDRMKPVHAGLIGSDCLILLDEAHLAEPFRQTLKWISVYRAEKWRDPKKSHLSPWGVSLLTATPGEDVSPSFALEPDDYENETLVRRLSASKPARLITVAKKERTAYTHEEDGAAEANWLDHFLEEVRNALSGLRNEGIAKPSIAVVVNRVGRARLLFERQRQEIPEIDRKILLIGPARPVDRDEVVKALDPTRTGKPRPLEQSILIVATQCIEAGVDLDLDGLISEAAPIDALRQRFGRLNRSGRKFTPYAAIIRMKSSSADDPVYGTSLRPAWDYLNAIRTGNGPAVIVDFGFNAFKRKMVEERLPLDALSPKDDAPTLLPAHLDLLSQTSPVPDADPEVGLYLHGIVRQPDSVSVIWRADLNSHLQDENVRRLFLLVPPRSTEAIELPLWAVRRWLMKQGKPASALADIPSTEGRENESHDNGTVSRIFRWRGDSPDSKWIYPERIRPGDTVIVPGAFGGLDEYGWYPEKREPVEGMDVADRASTRFSGRHYAVRVAPGLLGADVKQEELAEALASSVSEHWRHLRASIDTLRLPPELHQALKQLDRAKKKRVRAYSDIYGLDDRGRPQGTVFVAEFGIEQGNVQEQGQPGATEDDFAGSLPGFSLPLEVHSSDVERKAEEFARRSGLPQDRIADLKLAGYLHDAGKVDPRFQAWLHYRDPLGPDPGDPKQVLAKSGRYLPPAARAGSELPLHWRHEALWVRLATETSRFAQAKDPELVLWLIGAHHGYGRPFFPHEAPNDANVQDFPAVCGLPEKLMPGPGPQSLSFNWKGFDWATLYERLKARDGIWELARMEAVLRLPDHRASEEAAENHALAAGGTV